MSFEIVKGINGFDKIKSGVVATIGTFDGLHLGHQAILQKVRRAQEEMFLLPIAITFEPHPRVLVTPDSPPLLLTTWEEKVKLFSRYLSGKLMVIEFNHDIMNMTAEEFIRNFLVERLSLKKLIVGYDHAFGKNRSGTINDLTELSKKYSFELEIVEPVIISGKPVSSSRIRRLMAENRYAEALTMLGHSYPIAGIVKKGINLGKKLGFPTANLEYSMRKMLPREGVYSCSLEINNRYYDGMIFIGVNHFNPSAGISIEVNIFEFGEDIYGREIFCYPEVYLRENKKYGETSELINQIKLDKENVLRIKSRGESRNAC